jgi:hypothetical protein
MMAIVTGDKSKSRNPKTGDMLQVWIMPSDIAPHDAVKTGDDASVCGDCKFRPSVAKPGEVECYVTTFQGPRSAYEKWKRGGHPDARPEDIAPGKPARLGAWGDPATVPFETLDRLAKGRKTLGYTHQWRQPWFDPRHLELSMASVNSADERLEVKRMHGDDVRTYRVLAPGDTVQTGEILCPHTERGVQCVDCGLCNGKRGKAKDIAVKAV